MHNSIEKKYILAIDQGTTSSRTLLLDRRFQIIASAQREIQQIYPHNGWVEHDPLDIWNTQLHTIKEALRVSDVNPNQIAAIGVTNQRETVVAWDKDTGLPICNAIVWQDKRTAGICDEIKKDSIISEYIRHNTGLVIDSYFSGTKIHWILNNVATSKYLMEENRLMIGTIDTWLIWNLTRGESFTTDVSNASRTMLFNISSLEWDDRLLSYFDISENILPEVKSSADDFGTCYLFGEGIPITGVLGDQQAALFGQKCFDSGMAKNTYGTGCFMLMNIGEEIFHSNNGLLTTVAWKIGKRVQYAMEGSIFIGGAVIQWMRDNMNWIKTSEESEVNALQVDDSGGVVIVPAFTGLGAPYWDMYSRGAIYGITRDTNANHMVRAGLESIAFQTYDLLRVMENNSNIKLSELAVDGGASNNNYLMQFQSDILNVTICKSENIECTGLGVAMLAGIQSNFCTWDDLTKINSKSTKFYSQMDEETRKNQLLKWSEAISKTLS